MARTTTRAVTLRSPRSSMRRLMRGAPVPARNGDATLSLATGRTTFARARLAPNCVPPDAGAEGAAARSSALVPPPVAAIADRLL